MNIAEKLSREIERVTELREWIRLGKIIPEDGPATATMSVMTAAINAGHTAIGSGDAMEVLKALKVLEGCQP